jgi:hypothetical protein
MTDDYALGSLQGGILQPIQQHTWDVTFTSEKPNNTIFTLHPFTSGRELAMFFPEEIKFLAGEVDRYHLVYTNPNKWNSSSPYEQTYQHGNALIVLYNIEEGAKHPHIDGFFPKNLDERIVDSTGWIFCRAGKTYVAFRPLMPYEWIEEEVNWRWRSTSLKNGVVVEVGSASGFGDFGAFQKRIRSNRLAAPEFEKNLTVEYTTGGGQTMRFRYGGERLLDGKQLDFRTFGLFRGPFMDSNVGEGLVRLKYGGRTRTLDFNNATITEN